MEIKPVFEVVNLNGCYLCLNTCEKNFTNTRVDGWESLGPKLMMT